VARCWDERLLLAILEKAKSMTKPRALGQLLVALFAQGCLEAVDFARSLLQTTPQGPLSDRQRATVAAISLIKSETYFDWRIIWQAMESDEEFGREFVLALADRYDPELKGITGLLSEEDVASLYIWVAKQFPRREDPPFKNGSRPITPRTEVAFFRNALLQQLENRGTLEAITSVEKIAQAFPGERWLSWVKASTRASLLRNMWSPLSPAELLELASGQGKRIVQSGVQLLDVLCESLERLENKLQGRNPSAWQLWDQVNWTRGKELFRPKDENCLSNHVASYLEEDLSRAGIVALREVQIRRGEGSGKGELTDVFVTGTMTDSQTGAIRSIAAIIEVKGCWHRELRTAMETQLVGRYLKDNQCKYGLYLVGWYLCPQWEPEDARHKAVPFQTIEEARIFFDNQARYLSGEITIKSAVVNAALR
jgi:hypothetical protein